jgi:hypothetical protein
MSTTNVNDIEEARRWGRSLIVSGLLIIILVSLSDLDLTEFLIIMSVAIVMMWGGFCLCRLSDDVFRQISTPRSK